MRYAITTNGITESWAYVQLTVTEDDGYVDFPNHQQAVHFATKFRFKWMAKVVAWALNCSDPIREFKVVEIEAPVPVPVPVPVGSTSKQENINLEKLSYQDLITKLREGEIYVHSSYPESDRKLQKVLKDAFGSSDGIYDKYKWYGKFGRIYAGFYWRQPEQTVDIEKF